MTLIFTNWATQEQIAVVQSDFVPQVSAAVRVRLNNKSYAVVALDIHIENNIMASADVWISERI